MKRLAQLVVIVALLVAVLAIGTAGTDPDPASPPTRTTEDKP